MLSHCPQAVALAVLLEAEMEAIASSSLRKSRQQVCQVAAASLAGKTDGVMRCHICLIAFCVSRLLVVRDCHRRR